MRHLKPLVAAVVLIGLVEVSTELHLAARHLLPRTRQRRWLSDSSGRPHTGALIRASGHWAKSRRHRRARVRTCRNWLKRARVLGSGLLSGLDQTAHLVPARELLITALRALIPRKPTAAAVVLRVKARHSWTKEAWKSEKLGRVLGRLFACWLGEHIFGLGGLRTSIFFAPHTRVFTDPLYQEKNHHPYGQWATRLAETALYYEKWVFVFFHFFFCFCFSLFSSSFKLYTHTFLVVFGGFYEFSRGFWSLSAFFFLFLCFQVVTVYSSSSKTGSDTLSSMRSSAGR